MWGCLGLANMALYVAVFVGKAVSIVLGVIWIWGVDNVPCHTAAAGLYKASSTYLIAAIVLFGVQLILGSVYLLLCGMMDALHEAVNNIKEEWIEERHDQFIEDDF